MTKIEIFNKIAIITLKDWTDIPNVDIPLSHELPQPDLKKHEGHPTTNDIDEVGNEKRSSTILITEVGESPNVPQTHRKSDTSQDELPTLAPDISLGDIGVRDGIALVDLGVALFRFGYRRHDFLRSYLCSIRNSTEGKER